MKRRRVENPDSLELLLDTICNTFGAVIFISIVISLLVKDVGNQQNLAGLSAEIAGVMASRQQELANVKSRQAMLARQIKLQQHVIDRFANDKSKALALQISHATSARVQLLDSKATAYKDLSDSEHRTLTLEAMMKERDQELQQLRKETELLEADFKEVTARSTRTAHIPRVRATQKSGIAFMLHAGRLHRAVTPLGEVDERDCDQSEVDGTVRIVPRPLGGLVIPDSDVSAADADQQIEDRFQGISTEQQFVRLFVSQDSFAQFITVKDALIRRGLEYEVILFEDNRAELFLTTEQRESFVQ
jgi:hypothetical protein